jgi:hypothetical protein
VTAARLDIHFTQIPAALRRVRLGPDGLVLGWDNARSVTSDAGAPVMRFELPAGSAIDSVRIELETAQTPGWPQIDAVALTDTGGAIYWAQSADASTSAFMAGAVSMHDLPTPEILSKLALRLDEAGETERARAVRALRDAATQ